MLNAYYSKGANSKELFAPLKISQEPNYIDHLNKHNVIWIDMASVYKEVSSDDEFIKELNMAIVSELNEMYPNILTENENLISKALRKIYNATKETFIFLIDEWDVVFRESSNNKLKDDYINLLRTLFKASDTSTCIDLVYMTGILPIKRYNTESALNNFEEYTMLDSAPISEYMGFTKDEVIGLCEKYNMDYKEMKRWYDGYTLNGVELYNPKSVVTALTKKKYNNYWISTSAIESVNNYIKYQDGNLYDELLNLINGEEEIVSISGFNNDIHDIDNRESALTVLIHLGYLAYNGYGKCRIPNYEIKNEMLKNLTRIKESPYNDIIKLSSSGVMGLFKGETKDLDKALTSNHKLLASNFNKTKEDVLSCVVLFTFIPLLEGYIQQKEVNSITGRADIIYLSKTNEPPIIVELKVDSSALTAIEQIKNKGYSNALEGYHGKVYIVGINYDNTTLEHKTIIEEIEI